MKLGVERFLRGPLKELEIGRLIRMERVRTGLSISRLAGLSGVGKATISRWESGECRPDIPSLDSVLQTLGSDLDLRRQMLDLIDRPRALREKRAADWAEVAVAAALGLNAPVPGDLLRAMRRRKGLRVDDLAAQMGVAPGAISMWESSDRFPGRDTLERLCTYLEAGELERNALFRGDFASVMPSTPGTIQELRELCKQRFVALETPNFWNTMDLRFLILEDHAWRIARRDSEAIELLANLYGLHANALAEMERPKEAVEMAIRALDLAPEGGLFGDTMADAQCVVAYGYFLRGKPSSIQRAIEIVEDCLPYAEGARNRMVEHHMLARFYAAAGVLPEATKAFEQVERIADAADDPRGREFAIATKGMALLECGWPAEAAAVLSNCTTTGPKLRFEQCCDCARAFAQSGEPTEAKRYLGEAYRLAMEHGFPTTDADRVTELVAEWRSASGSSPAGEC